MTGAAVVDRDEYGEPVGDRYKRLGAGAERADETGLYVRFEPGFGLNVHVGIRAKHLKPGDRVNYPSAYVDEEQLVLGIHGWERLCELVDEYRAREAAHAE